MSLRPAMVFPDIERLLVVALTGRLSAQVRTDVPNPRTPPFVVVRRIGGVPYGEVLDRPLVAVETWHTTRSGAAALAVETRAEIASLVGTVVDGWTFGRVLDVSGPARLPDEDTDDERYTFTTQIAVRGHAL